MESTSRKRILFLMSRFLDGGIDTVLVEYLRYLARRNDYELTLAIGISMGPLEVFANRLPHHVRVEWLVKAGWLTRWRQEKIRRHLPLPVKIYDEAVLSPIRRVLISRGLPRLTAIHDVVIDFDCCYYSFLSKINTPLRKIAWFHFSFEQAMQQNRRRMLRIGRQLVCYDKVVTISEAMREEGLRLFPQLADKLCVIYNAKDREQLLQRAAEGANDSGSQFIPSPFSLLPSGYILAVERLEESQKDLTTLLHAFQQLCTRYQHNEKLVIIGKGHSEEQLKQLALQLGIADNVLFLGFQSNPYGWMQHCRLLVHSAKFEGLPTVLIEALMLNCLIVATDCPTGPREILDDGKAGLLTPVGDATAMADAMHRLLTEPDLQKRIREGMARRYRYFTFEETGKLFDALL